MSAVLSAFVQYIIRTKKNMESNTAGTGNTSGK